MNRYALLAVHNSIMSAPILEANSSCNYGHFQLNFTAECFSCAQSSVKRIHPKRKDGLNLKMEGRIAENFRTVFFFNCLFWGKKINTLFHSYFIRGLNKKIIHPRFRSHAFYSQKEVTYTREVPIPPASHLSLYQNISKSVQRF